MININGKTYKQKYFAGIYQIEEQLLKLIEEGVLEEVKEKPLSQKRAEAIERGKDNIEQNQIDAINGKSVKPVETHIRTASILEKLREELERRIEEYPNKNCANIANMYVVQELESFRDFITSLETKEENKKDKQPLDPMNPFLDDEDYVIGCNARPLPQEDIELPQVPDFDFHCDSDFVEDTTPEETGKQVDRLTICVKALYSTVNQLIKANKKPL